MHDPYEIRPDTPRSADTSGPADAPGPSAADAPAGRRSNRSGARQPTGPSAAGQPQARGTNPVTVLLWTLTAILAGLNTALSIAGHELLGALGGAGAVACLITLLLRHLRQRR